MGLFSSAQFLGAFAGGLLGGTMLAYESQNQAFLQLSVLIVVWWVVAFFMKKPKAVTSRIVSLGALDEPSMINFREKAEQLPGVQEITVYLEDKVAYLKVDKKLFDDGALEILMAK